MAKSLRKDAGWIAPMLPTLADDVPTGDGWIHEIKHDGWRISIVIQDGSARVFTRNGLDYTAQFRCIAKAAEALKVDAVIDAEAIVQDDQGRSDFEALRRAMSDEPHRVIAFAFDLLRLGDRDLRPLPLIERRSMLRQLLDGRGSNSAILFSDDVGDGVGLFAAAESLGLEGIVSKRANSRYRSGQALSWLKIKSLTEDAFVVVGAEREPGKPPHALLARPVDGRLEYAGSAFVTLGDKDRERFWRAMERLRCDEPPVAVSKSYAASWCRPEIAVTARYLRGSDKLRHATLTGMA